ncbi:MAG: BatD family protein, partial [Cetobacterium sp.]
MKKVSLFFIMLSLCKLSFSELIVNVSNLTPSKNDVIGLNISFLDEDKEEYSIEGIEKFQVLSKGSSNSYKSINGSTTSTKSDVYNIQAKEEGELVLTVVTEKGVRKTVNINVKTVQETNDLLSQKFLIKGTTSKNSYYFGEKIPYEEYFISAVTLNSFAQMKTPSFKEFTSKDVTPYSGNNYIQSKIDFNEKQAVQLTLFKGILQANSSGTKNILTSTVQVGEASKDFFTENKSFVGGENLEIEIKPLPENPPKNFKDIVGKINFLENWKTSEVKVGEAISLTLTLHGTGNLALLDSLQLEGNNDFNVFQSVKNYKENIIDGKYFNEKVFEIAFIPKKSGVQKTPEININYFNVETENYEVLKISSKEISVSGQSPNDIVPEKNLSPIPENKENNSEVKSEETKTAQKIVAEVEELDIKVLEVEKPVAKNIYKLGFWILAFLTSLISILFTGYVLTRKKVKSI